MRLRSITRLMTGGFEIESYEVQVHAGAPSRLKLGSPNSVSSANPVCTIGKRHRCGTHPRSCHFCRVEGEIPNASAAGSIFVQSGDVLMVPSLTDDSSAPQGQFGGGIPAVDCLRFDMAPNDNQSDAEFDKALQRRAKELMRSYRISKNWNHQEMAEFVGTSKANYQKYELPQADGAEKRNTPLRVIYRFCERADVDLHFMLNGKKKLRKTG